MKTNRFKLMENIKKGLLKVVIATMSNVGLNKYLINAIIKYTFYTL